VNLGNVSQCLAKGNELDVSFVDSESSNRDDQALYSMRLWVPGQSAAEVQAKVLAKASVSSATGDVIVEFDRDQGTFVTPKNRYNVEMYENSMRIHGSSYEYKIKYSDISRYYMLEKPVGRKAETSFFYFVICLDKPIRQGQQKYPYLVWQTMNEETELRVNLEEAALEAAYPGGGLKPLLEGALHKSIAKVFKVLTGKTIFAGSRRYKSADGNQCVTCNFGQRSGLLYPNDKSFVFLHQPTMVIEYSEVDYVEFVKAAETRNFDFIVQLKGEKGVGESGKKLKFGAIEKKEFNAIAEFVKEKESFFTVRNYQPEAADDDDDDEDEDDDEDFGSEDGKEEDSGDDDDDDDDDDGGGGGGDETARKAAAKAEGSPKKRKLDAAPLSKASKTLKSESPTEAAKKKKKDANAPKAARSAFQLWSNWMRPQIKAADKSFAEVNRELGQKWKDLDATTKADWQMKASSDKERHSSEMESYIPAEGGGKKKRKAKAKDPNAPKKPLTAYFFFVAREREATKAEHPGVSTSELAKIMGSKWSELGDEGKAPFNAQAADAKDAYKAAMVAYAGAGASVKVEHDDDDDDDDDDAAAGDDDDDAAGDDE
jgi:structure-specific recognition protein 1